MSPTVAVTLTGGPRSGDIINVTPEHGHMPLSILVSDTGNRDGVGDHYTYVRVGGRDNARRYAYWRDAVPRA